MKNSRLWIVAIVVVLIAGVGMALAYHRVNNDKVGNYAQVPSSTPTPTPTVTVTSTPTVKSGIEGTVLLGPTCPVMRNPPDPQCADKPYSTALAVTTSDGSETIKTFHSDAAGKFMVELPPGMYSIRSVSGTSMLPRCGVNAVVTVRAGGYSNVTVYCDTGIR
jgi:hypothetical protein